MSVLAAVGVIGSLLSAGYGAYKSSQAAKEVERKNAEKKKAVQAWYDRNYYQDYLNTVEAQNAIKRVKDAWRERIKEERGRQVITGGTPEQVQAVAETGGRAVGETVASLAAQGEARKAAIDEKKLEMDNSIAEDDIAVALQKQKAGANLMQNGLGLAASSLQAFEPKGRVVQPVSAQPVGKITDNFVNTDMELPKTVSMIDIPQIDPGLSRVQKVDNVGVAGRDAAINPDIVIPENEYYSKKKKYY